MEATVEATVAKEGLRRYRQLVEGFDPEPY
jgi:hypothetical protein